MDKIKINSAQKIQTQLVLPKDRLVPSKISIGTQLRTLTTILDLKISKASIGLTYYIFGISSTQEPGIYPLSQAFTLTVDCHVNTSP